MKKLLTALCVLTLAIACLLVLPTRAEAVTQGDYTYEVLNGEAILMGYAGTGENITIPSSLGGYPVTVIATAAFSDCDGLVSAQIPNTVVSIGDYAFSGCSGLSAITIPNSVTTIGNYAFKDCTSLTTLTVSDTLTTIGYSPFYNCPIKKLIIAEGSEKVVPAMNFGGAALKEVVLPSSLTAIGDYAFSGNIGLTSLTIPDGVTAIGKYAFNGCSGLSSVNVPKNVVTIGEGAFEGCTGLTSVTLPDGITTMGARVFKDCANLISVKLPGGIRSVEPQMFENCAKLTTVTMPDSVTRIQSSAFKNCSKLTSVTIPDSVYEIGDYAFYNCDGLYSVAFPDRLQTVGEYAFYDCDKIKTITIPKVYTVSAYSFARCDRLECVTMGSSTRRIKEGAFMECAWLTTVTVAGDAEVNLFAFSGCNITKIIVAEGSKTIARIPDISDNVKEVIIPNSVTAISDNAFYGCEKLNSITIPDSVTTIGTAAFRGCPLISITIPDSVESIGERAFYSCSSLQSVKMGSGVATIGGSAFAACDRLTNVKFPDNITYTMVRAFSDCYGLKYNIYDNAKYLGSEKNPYAALVRVVDISMKSYTIHEQTKFICSYAFGNCGNMASVTIPDSVELIGTNAFYNCSGLMFVSVGDRVETIDSSAFYGCSSLLTITIPDSVTFIGSSAFYGCSKLTNITLPEGITTIGEQAFGRCDSLNFHAHGDYQYLGTKSNPYYALITGSSVYEEPMHQDTKIIADSACSNNKYMGRLVIPSGVIAIGKAAFDACSDLYSVTIPTSVTTIGDRAFSWYNLYDVYYLGTEAQWKNIAIGLENEGWLEDLSFVPYPEFVKITVQPKDAAAPNGTQVKTSLTATGDGLKYQWYFKNKGATTWGVSSLTGNEYHVTMKDTVDGCQVYCVVTDQYGNSVKSDVVTLYMGNPAKITAQPKNAVAANNTKVTTSLTATGDGLTYTWYFKNKTATSYSVSSITTNTYTMVMDSTRNGRSVYCVVTDKYGNSVKSNVVTLSMKTVAKITKQPTNIAVANGVQAKTTLIATGDGLTYKWYFKNKTATTYSVSSITTNTYTMVMDSVRNGRSVYCVVTDKYGNSVKSNVVTLSMKTVAKITKQPTNATAANGTQVKTSLTATGDGLKYAWYFRNAGATTWSKSSLTGNSYYVTMKAATKGRQVYCLVTDKYGTSVKSNVVTLNMGNPAKITKQPTNAAAPNGTRVKTTLTATGDGLKYAWYFRNAGATTWSKSSLTGNSYYVTMKATTKGRQVYCLVTDKYGNSVKSDVVTLYMGNPAKITTQPKSVTVANGKQAKTTIKATGDGLTYTWYFRNAGTTTWSKSSLTGNSYYVTMKSTTKGRQVYCVVTDKYGNSVKSDVVTLYMGNPAKITTQPKSVTVANGKQAKTTIKATGDGLTYTWYFRNAGTTTWSKSSLTGNSYYVTMKSTTKGRQVYCVVTDKYGNTVTSNVVTLNMK